MKTNSYSGRIDMLPRTGCEVCWDWTISAIKDCFYCLQDVNIMDTKVDHVRVKVKWCFKGKGDKVKFKGKVKLYDKERKVWLSNVLFL